MYLEERPREQQEDRANVTVTGNGGVGTEGVSGEQSIPRSGGQYDHSTVYEASEGGGWEVGGNSSVDLFEEHVLRRRSTRRE